jgi:hypothetical protein
VPASLRPPPQRRLTDFKELDESAEESWGGLMALAAVDKQRKAEAIESRALVQVPERETPPSIDLFGECCSRHKARHRRPSWLSCLGMDAHM